MKRRCLLHTTGLVGVSLAGCVAPTSGPGKNDCPGKAPPLASGLDSAKPPMDGSVDLPVPMSELSRGALRDEIPSITDPRFARDWSSVDDSLTPGDLVIGIQREGRARAYPLATLATYEVVNDDFMGPLLVTYCPLCATGLAAVREVRGEETVFGVSGLLYRANLVMYDRRTDSLWSQLFARAIRGPETGSTLTLVPSRLTRWKDWVESYPGSEVLLPPPISGTISHIPEAMPHGVHGHVGVQDVDSSFGDDRLPSTTLVIGVATGTISKAYPIEQVGAAGVINDCVGGLPVVVAGRKLPQAFDRRVNGEVLWFERAGSNRIRGGGSTWEVTTGRALTGPHEGATLVRAPGSTTMYWFAWLEVHPETAVHRA